MNARYYWSYIYRMLTPDVIVPDPTNPQSYNRYSYVNNRPVNYTDPSGHVAECGVATDDCEGTPPPVPGLVLLPFTPTSQDDPRHLQYAQVVYVDGESHVLRLPVFTAKPGVQPGVPAPNQQAADSLAFWGWMFDTWALGISASHAVIQGAALAFPAAMLDDAIVTGSYTEVIDPWENRISRLGIGATVLADYYSGASSFEINYDRLLDSQITLGQDTVFEGLAVGLGEVVGRIPFIGSTLDSAINTGVVAYDIGRLYPQPIPTFFELRINHQNSFYFLGFYTDQE